MKRVFIAIKIDPAESLLSFHSSLREMLCRERIKWTDPANIHLTLAFLGDTHEDMISVAGKILKNTCTGFGEFRFVLAGTGVFRDYRDPRVIWLGTRDNEKLVKLNNKINSGLKDAGFRLEERPFNPHITLGRIKSVRNSDLLKSSLEKYRDAFIQEVTVREVILFESILKPAGPEYRPEERFSVL